MKEWTFSTVLYVDREDLFGQALDSLRQVSKFSTRLQLIVVDPWCAEEVRETCAGLENVQYLPEEGAEIAAAYQRGLRHAKGKIINFTLASATYSEGAYWAAERAMGLYGRKLVAVVPLQQLIDGTLGHYRGACSAREEEETLDWREPETLRLNLLLQSWFFQADTLRGKQFDESLRDEALNRFLLEVQLENPETVYLKEEHYYYTLPLEDNPSSSHVSRELWWYQESVERFLIPMLEEHRDAEGRIPALLQWACYYFLFYKFNCNTNDRNKGVLASREEVQDFLNAAFRMLSMLDTEVIMTNWLTTYCRIDRGMRTFFLKGKALVEGRTLRTYDNGTHFMTVLERPGETLGDEDGYPVSRTNRERLSIRIFNYDRGMLTVDANIGLVDIMAQEQFHLFARVKIGEQITQIEAEYPEVYPLFKCFGYTIQRKRPVQFHIPVTDDPIQTLRFYFEFEGKEYPLRLSYQTAYSRMTNKNQYSYWLFREGWMLARQGLYALSVRKVSKWYHIRREILYNWRNWKIIHKWKKCWEGTMLRLEYWRKRKEYSARHIWVTYDKLYKAGDNGEYMYQYLRKNCPEIDAYYIISREAPEFERMVREDPEHILELGTRRCQIVALLAEVILSTQASTYMRFDPRYAFMRYNKSLLRGETVCIQHGLTIQKIAQYQNRRFDNTKLYCCASPYEVRNLSHPMYGYEPEDLKMTGLARYDGLVNRDQKIILITPSWRRNVISASVGSVRRPHNDEFRNTTYFKIYNSLINDETLIDCARKNGYRIIYLLHPVMSGQIDDFDRNDYVELVPATGDMSYEKILCESSLMVTDYSGVQFDFAYMRKPIIYYHPDDLPAHYGDGGMDYETMGFGPICTGHEQVVNAICRAMESQCKTEPEYIRRADHFFAFNDHNNCERIYHTVKDWLARRQEENREEAK